MTICLFGLAFSAIAQSSPDPGRPDLVILDSVAVEPGKPFTLSLKVQADDTTFSSEMKWAGVGSFCLPLKYNSKALKIDSVKFTGTVAQWDERFTNAKFDTGFISFAGIHNIAGKDNPVLLSPDKPEEIAKIFGSVHQDAKPGVYHFELTIDPIQKEAYLGSIDGMNGWKPKFIPGTVVVE
jgi:hypothetical protein